MSQHVTGKQVSETMDIMFGSGTKTTLDRILLVAGKISSALAIGGQPAYLLLSKLNAPRQAQYAVLAVMAVSAIIFIVVFCLLGIREAGRSGGKTTLFGQTVYVLARVTLFVLLPCAVLTAALVVWAILTKQPAFR